MNVYNNAILKQVFTSVIINTTQCRPIKPIFTLNFMLDRNNTNNVAIHFYG